jgi:hypothetical protein
MPYQIAERNGEYCVVKKDDPEGKSFGCHPSQEKAQAQMAAIYANEGSKAMEGLADHLAKKIGGDPGFFTRCMGDESVAEYDEETRSAVCAKAHEMVVGKWPAEKKEYGFKALPNGKWLGWWTNAFKDRDGEIFETKAIQEYVDSFDPKAQRVPLLFWHMPVQLGTTEWMGLVGRIGIAAGTLNETGMKAARYMEEHPEYAVGMSHGFFWRSDEKGKDGVDRRFRSFEVSCLPAEAAANTVTPFTPLTDGGNSIMAVTKEKEGELAKIVGTETATAELAKAETVTAELEKAGVEFKEVKEEGKKDTVTTTVEKPQDYQVIMTPESLDQIATAVAAKLNIAGVPAAVEALTNAVGLQTEALKELAKGDEVKLKERLDRLPKAQIFRATQQPVEQVATKAAASVKSPIEMTLQESIAVIATARAAAGGK